MPSWRRLSCGIVFAVLACGGGCNSSKSQSDAGGTAGTAGGGDGAAGADAASSGDAPAADVADGDGSACPVDGAIVADPFAGVWTAVQNNETYTFTNNAGCSTWTGSSGGTVCDLCVGTYVLTDGRVASATLRCHPVGACSVSPVHTDVGPFKLTGCTMTYDYDYGGGSSSVSGMRVADTTADVCGQIDGGTD